MSWWSAALRSESRSWILTELAPPEGGGVTGQPLAPDGCYVSVLCQAMHLQYSRKLGTRFYGVLGSTCSVAAGFGQPSDLMASQVVAPDNLKQLDGKHLDRVVTGASRLFGPVPYRGGDLSVELGLLAVPEEQLLEPYLDLLASVAQVAGLASGPLATTAVTGLKALLQSGAELLIGVSTTWPAPRSAAYAVVRAPSRLLASRQLALAGHELHWAEAGRFTPVPEPYLVFTVEAAPVRHDWMRIPELVTAWQVLDRDVLSGDFQRVQPSLALFRRTALLSAQLLPADAQRLGDLAAQRVKTALPATQTGAPPRAPGALRGPGAARRGPAAAPAPRGLGSLASLDLFRDS